MANEARSPHDPFERETLLPLIALLDDPSEPLHLATIRALLALHPHLPEELRQEVEIRLRFHVDLDEFSLEEPGSISEAPLSSPAADQDEADSPYGDPEKLRRTYQEADGVESRFYPAWALASHGEPDYLETVLVEIEAGPLNFPLIRYARESHSERFPTEVAEHFAGIAADESCRGDVRQIAYSLSRRSQDAPPEALPTALP